MPYGLNRGLGAVNLFGQRCTPGDSYSTRTDDVCPAPNWWLNLWGIVDTTVAVAPAPTSDALTVPPASGESAAALVQSLSDQQVAAQQAANAEGVKSGVLDQWSSDIVDTANAATSGVTSALPWILGAVGLGIFALVAFSGGSARRYGR